MPLVTVLTGDPAVEEAVRSPHNDLHPLAAARSWDRLLWLVRERPVTAVVLDSDALRGERLEDAVVGELTRRYPSVPIVFVARSRIDPIALFRLGRAGIADLVLLPADSLERGLAEAVRRALRTSTQALVARVVSPRVPPREANAVGQALEGVQRGWATADLSGRLGLTRAHASVRLRACGLPSAGHLLTWAKLLHAGRWLSDPGRSAESVSRQLEYSSGAAFRRALRNYVGLTPTEVSERGGLRPVLERFLDACGLGGSLQIDISAA